MIPYLYFNVQHAAVVLEVAPFRKFPVPHLCIPLRTFGTNPALPLVTTTRAFNHPARNQDLSMYACLC